MSGRYPFPADATHYAVLAVAKDADADAIHAAYERAHAAVEQFAETGGAHSVVELARTRIDEAWLVLADDEARASYDRSFAQAPSVKPARTASMPPVRILEAVFDDEAPPTLPPLPATASGPLDQPVPVVTAPVGPTATATADADDTDDDDDNTNVALKAALALLNDGEVNGQVLRKLREARGFSLPELAELTHISRSYLEAIERMDLPALPARVYLRGFLTQVARVLKVDAKRLAEGYIAFVDRFGG